MRWDEATRESITIRDVAAGEELTENYAEFDAAWPEYGTQLAATSMRPAPPTFETLVERVGPLPTTGLAGAAPLVPPRCTCTHAPEQHDREGCEVFTLMNGECLCKWDGARPAPANRDAAPEPTGAVLSDTERALVAIADERDAAVRAQDAMLAALNAEISAYAHKVSAGRGGGDVLAALQCLQRAAVSK
jgi:hypothetical protein